MLVAPANCQKASAKFCVEKLTDLIGKTHQHKQTTKKLRADVRRDEFFLSCTHASLTLSLVAHKTFDHDDDDNVEAELHDWRRLAITVF